MMTIQEKAEMKGMVADGVLKHLEYGRKHAMTRKQLVTLTGLNDRAVRECIELLRGEGYLICNEQDGRGYYLADTDDEIERQYRMDHARALSVLKRLTPYRRALKEAGRI